MALPTVTIPVVSQPLTLDPDAGRRLREFMEPRIGAVQPWQEGSAALLADLVKLAGEGRLDELAPLLRNEPG